MKGLFESGGKDKFYPSWWKSHRLKTGRESLKDA